MLFHVLKIQIIQLALLIECFFIKQGKLFLSLLISVARGKFYFNFTEFREIKIFGWYSTKKAASKTQPFFVGTILSHYAVLPIIFQKSHRIGGQLSRVQWPCSIQSI